MEDTTWDLDVRNIDDITAEAAAGPKPQFGTIVAKLLSDTDVPKEDWTMVINEMTIILAALAKTDAPEPATDAKTAMLNYLKILKELHPSGPTSVPVFTAVKTAAEAIKSLRSVHHPDAVGGDASPGTTLRATSIENDATLNFLSAQLELVTDRCTAAEAKLRATTKELEETVL